MESDKLIEGIEDEKVKSELLEGAVLGSLVTNDDQVVLHVLMGDLIAHCLGFALNRQR